MSILPRVLYTGGAAAVVGGGGLGYYCLSGNSDFINLQPANRSVSPLEDPVIDPVIDPVQPELATIPTVQSSSIANEVLSLNVEDEKTPSVSVEEELPESQEPSLASTIVQDADDSTVQIIQPVAQPVAQPVSIVDSSPVQEPSKVSVPSAPNNTIIPSPDKDVSPVPTTKSISATSPVVSDSSNHEPSVYSTSDGNQQGDGEIGFDTNSVRDPGRCAKDMFSDYAKSDQTKLSFENKIEEDGLGTDNKSDTEGCLIIYGANFSTRTRSASDKNQQKHNGGKFKFIWSIKNEKQNKGVIFEVKAESVRDKRFVWFGNVFSVEKQDDGGKTIKKVPFISNSKNGQKTVYRSFFPKSKSGVAVKWGEFIRKIEEGSVSGCSISLIDSLDNSYLCGGQPTIGGWRWHWKGDAKGSENVGDWMENLNEGWGVTFGYDRGNIMNLIKGINGKGSDYRG